MSLRTDYERDGFAVIERLFSAESIASIRQGAVDIVDDFDVNEHRSVFSTKDRDKGRDDYFTASAEAIHCFLEEDALDSNGQLSQEKELSINKIGHALHDLDPVFNGFCRQAIVAEVLRDIGYQAPQLWQTMYIFKQPRIGGEVRWHQDASYLINSPSTGIGLWVAVEDAHRENGCLWVQPGGQHSPLRDLYQYDHEKRQGELHSVGDTPWPEQSEALAVEVPAGSLVMFNDHMPHFSSQNRSENSRHAFTMHVVESGSDWSKENWLQRPTLGAFML
jgi:phytanoyl-CoA hydroxylase